MRRHDEPYVTWETFRNMRYRRYTALPGLKWMTYRAGVRCVGAGYKVAVALQVYITEVLLGPQGYDVW